MASHVHEGGYTAYTRLVGNHEQRMKALAEGSYYHRIPAQCVLETLQLNNLVPLTLLGQYLV